jgi:hypothetical protein
MTVSISRFMNYNLQESGNKFNVKRVTKNGKETLIRCTVDVENRICECGHWQEHEIPCIDAIAYFRHHKQLTIVQVMRTYVDKKYTYENEKQLLVENIIPVCMETIDPDGLTTPPLPLTKRSSGRPKSTT